MTTKWSHGCSWFGMYCTFLEGVPLIVTILGFSILTVVRRWSRQVAASYSALFTWGCIQVLFFIVVISCYWLGKMFIPLGTDLGSMKVLASPPTINSHIGNKFWIRLMVLIIVLICVGFFSFFEDRCMLKMIKLSTKQMAVLSFQMRLFLRS